MNERAASLPQDSSSQICGDFIADATKIAQVAITRLFSEAMNLETVQFDN